MQNALPDSVAPFAIFVREQFPVHGPHRFLDACLCVGVERELQALRDVPCQRELSVPDEIFAYRDRKLEIRVRLASYLLLEIEPVYSCQE